MLRLLVSSQVHFSLETLPAEVTAERLKSRVFPAVRDEVGALAEGLPAHLALVRLLTCGKKREKFRWKWPFFTHDAQLLVLFKFTDVILVLYPPPSPPTCVDESVLLHVRLLVEPLPAVLARIRPRVRMDEQVRGKRGGALEAFAADFAAEAPLL